MKITSDTMSSGSVSATDMVKGKDSYIASLESGIEKIKKQMQELSENKDLSMEEKQERRKALQQQIQEMNRQIMQRKQELYKEEHEKQDTLSEALPQRQEESSLQGMSASVMGKMVKSGTILQNAKQGMSIKKSFDNQVSVIETEIKLDSSRRTFSDGKEAALADISKRSANLHDKVLKDLGEILYEDESDDKETNNNKGRLDGLTTEEEEIQNKMKERNGNPRGQNVDELV